MEVHAHTHQEKNGLRLRSFKQTVSKMYQNLSCQRHVYTTSKTGDFEELKY